jgi:hypothetical protein
MPAAYPEFTAGSVPAKAPAARDSLVTRNLRLPLAFRLDPASRDVGSDAITGSRLGT